MNKNLYLVLGVSKDAGDAEIKSAYRKLARQYHTDLNKDDKDAAEKFKEISCANDILAPVSVRAAIRPMEAVLSDREAAAPITAATEKISTSLPFSVTIFFHSLPAAVPAFRALPELRAVPARVRILPIPCGSTFWMLP